MASVKQLEARCDKQHLFAEKSQDSQLLIHKWYHYFIAGEFSGMVGTAVAFPFDTMKILMQQSKHQQKKKEKISNVNYNYQSKSILSQRGIVRSILSLYRGSLLPFFGNGLVYSTSFGINGTCRNICLKYLRAPEDVNCDLTMIECMICGGISGIGSTMIFTPMERVKCWSQVHGTNTYNSFQYLYKQFGIREGLLYGLKPTLVREISGFAVYYPIYEITSNILYISKKWHQDYYNQSITNLTKMIFSGRLVNDKMKEFSPLTIFISGAITGMAMWVVVYPFDVIKTRLQSSPANTYTNMLDCARGTYKEIGLFGYYKGVTPALFWAFGLHSSIFLCYENVLALLNTNYN